MSKVYPVILLLLFAFACNAPVTRQQPSAAYVVDTSMVDQTTNTLTVNIKLDSPVTEASVKAAGEAVINQHRNQFKSVVVKSFLHSQQSLYPYCISTLAEGAISHQVNKQLEPQKIPSH